MSFLGIDLGTSSVKIILMDEQGRVLESVSKEYPVHYPENYWAEQNPEGWWKAVEEGIGEITLKKEIKSIGLSGQMHGLVALDEEGKVLMPAMLWCDQRTYKECEEIEELIGQEKLSEYTGNKPLTGFTAPKILWVKKHKGQLYDKIKHILLPKDYIRFKLTGEYATDVSDASGTLLFNVKNRNWSKEMLKALNIDEGLMPKCFESYEITGYVKRAVAEKIGLNGEVAVIAGGGDQACGAIGTGTVNKGIISVSLGTSGVVFACQEEYVIDKKNRLHSFCHGNGKWHLMGVMLSAASSLKWWVENINADIKLNAFETILEESEKVEPGSNGLIFLPYLMGERTPYSDVNAKGVFIGLNINHKRAHMSRSIIEGVCFGLNDSLEIIRSLGIPIKEVRVSGGGAKSKLWRQTLADIFNARVDVINSAEGSAYGAAILAAVGVGAFKNIDEACSKLIKVTESIYPIDKNVKKYRQTYLIYNSLYEKLKDTFEDISKTL